MQALIGVLESRLSIRPDDATSLRIRVNWGTAEMAQALTQIAQKRFLETRSREETSVITAAIDILEDELKRAADSIEPEQQNVMRVREKIQGAHAARPDAAPAAPSDSPAVTYVRPAAKPAGTSAGLSTKLNEIRQAEREVQEPWQRRLTELRLQLSDLKSQYGPAHPLVVQQEAKIKDASTEPAELVSLRQDERELLSKIELGSSGDADASGSHYMRAAPRAAAAAPAANAAPPLVVEEEPEVAGRSATPLRLRPKLGPGKLVLGSWPSCRQLAPTKPRQQPQPLQWPSSSLSAPASR